MTKPVCTCKPCVAAAELAALRAALASSRAEQIRLSLQVSILTNERDEARALGRIA